MFGRQAVGAGGDWLAEALGVRRQIQDRRIALADVSLRKGGSFLAKIFQGDDFERIRGLLRARFEEVRVLKPEASRKESVEIFLVGLRRRDDPPPPATSTGTTT